MIDFKKLVFRERFYYLLMCRACGRQDWYTVNLAEKGFTCDGPSKNRRRYCGARLVCVAICKGELGSNERDAVTF